MRYFSVMLQRVSKRLAGFITDHIAWEFLTGVLAKPWALGIATLVAAAVTAFSWVRKQPLYLTFPVGVCLLLVLAAFVVSFSLKGQKISELRFDYLPERTPDQEDWKLVILEGAIKPTFTLAGDPPISDKCLYIRSNNRRIESYALDRMLELHESLCTTVKYAAKLTDDNTSVVYAHVRMTSIDGNQHKDGWLAHKFDTTSHVRKEPYPEEWTVMDPGKRVSQSSWRSFNWSLPEEVARTFGTDGGWIYKRLLRVRLRGTLSVTPIELLE